MNKEAARLRWYEVALCILVPVAFGWISVYRGQDMNWDLQNYHVYNPYAYLAGRLRVDLAPAQLQTYFNPLLDLPYHFAYEMVSPKLMGFLLGAVHGMCFIWVMLIARWLVPTDHRYTAALLALAGMFSCAFLGELGTTMGGPVTTLFVLISVWLLISRIDTVLEGGGRAIAVLLAAGFLCGSIVGLKLVNAPYAVGACVALLCLSSAGWQRRVAYAFVFGMAVLSGVAATFSYWGYTLYQEFGNPLFPQYNNIFRAPLAGPIGVADTRWATKGLGDALLLPFTMVIDGRRVSEITIAPLIWSVAYVLAILSFAKAIRFRFASTQLTQRHIFFSSFVIVSFAVWLGIFTYHRYLMPIELLAPLLCWVLAHYLFGRSVLRAGVVALTGVCAAVAIATAPDWGHAGWAEQSFRVTPPAIEQSESAVVLKVGPEPTAWVFPSFPGDTPIFGIGTNFPESPAYKAKVASILKERVGEVYAVLSPSELAKLKDRPAALLREFRLTLEPDACKRYEAHIGQTDVGYLLCRVRRQ